jgi:hypothetical protein
LPNGPNVAQKLFGLSIVVLCVLAMPLFIALSAIGNGPPGPAANFAVVAFLTCPCVTGLYLFCGGWFMSGRWQRNFAILGLGCIAVALFATYGAQQPNSLSPLLPQIGRQLAVLIVVTLCPMVPGWRRV